MRFVISAFVLLAACLPAATSSAAEWPQWRGPDGQGHAAATGLPTEWSETKNVTWKTKLPGRGHSSPVVENGRIWMTAGVETPISEEEKKRRTASNTGDQPLVVSGKLSLRALCVDMKSGKLLHNVELLFIEEPDWTHALNTFASPTPVIEDGRLYCHFGTHGNACLDTQTQEVMWTNRELTLRHENGPGSSPILWKDLMIFHCDGSDVQYVAALDKATGKVAWKTERSGEMRANPQLKKAYGTPLIVEIDGRDQLISPGADWLYSYDPATGKELWKVNYGVLGFSIVPRPVVGHGMIYFCTSFMRSQVLAVKYQGVDKPEIAWRYNKQAPQKPSPILVGEELYFVSDKGVATCLDAKTGQEHWQVRMGGNYSSSPLYADGKLYFCSHQGVTTVIKPGTKYEELAKNRLASDIMASPIALDGALFIRTIEAIYRIEQ